MTQHLNTRAAISWSSTGDTLVEHLHHLSVPLRRVQPAYSRSVYVSESLDRTALETVTVGNGAYELVGQVTFDNNPQQLLELLKAGDAGRTLTYYPDLRDPNVNYPCRLIGPRGGSLLTDLDGQRGTLGDAAVELRLRPLTNPSTTPFHPLDVASNVLFWLRAGDAITGATFSRATVARYAAAASGGTDTSAATNRLRLHYVDTDADFYRDTAALLLEGASTNLVSTNAIAGAPWVDVGTPVTTAGQADPADGTAAVQIEDDSAGAGEPRGITVAFSGNGSKAASAFVQRGTAATTGLLLRDTTVGATRGAAVITWTAGVPVVTGLNGTELILRPTYWRNGFWRIAFVTDGAVLAANTNQLWLYGASISVVGDTGTTIWYGPQAENMAWATSYILTTGTTQTRAADTLTFPFRARGQPLTAYIRFVEGGTILSSSDLYVLSLGVGAPTLAIHQAGSGAYRGTLDPGTGTQSTSIQAVAPVVGDVVELSVSVDHLGRVQCSQSINGGAITVAALGSAPSAGPLREYSSQTITFAGAVTAVFTGLLNVAVVRNVHTLEAMRRVARVAA